MPLSSAARLLRRAALCASLAAAPGAMATWSIIFVDTTTGEIGIASATCLTNFDLQAGASVVVVGKGAAAAQSFVDSTGNNRTILRDRLAAGVDPALILAELAATDSGHQSRQYGIVDLSGRTLTFTGTGAGGYASGITGSFDYSYLGRQGTIAYAIQGNVITGQAVLDAALNAAMNSEGDLPARLMASMEAARVFGGDGRCSCTTGEPTACGAPPPSFTKSADIGYYLVSRAGDADAASLNLSAGGTAIPAAADLDGDGRTDLLVPVGSTPGRILVYLNRTTPGMAMPVFAPSAPYNSMTSPAIVAVADWSGDGLPDVVIGGGSTSAGALGAITTYRGAPAGVLTTRADFATPARVTGLALADVTGNSAPDIIFHTSSSIYLCRNNGAGFDAPELVAAPGSVNNLSIADLNGDNHPDIIIGTGAAAVRVLPGQGNGAFGAQETPVSPGVLVRAAAPADLDLDGDTDLVTLIGPAGQSISPRLNTPGGFVAGPAFDYGVLVNRVTVGDINGDGLPDLATLDSSASLGAAISRGDGTYDLAPRFSVGVNSAPLLLAELTGDIYPEAIVNSGALRVIGNRRGFFGGGVGFAAGHYYMNFNVAFQQSSSPDPVFQLQDAFDAMRESLRGITDAVTSTVTVLGSLTPGGKGALHVQPFDWAGDPVHGAQRIIVEQSGTGGVVVGASIPGGAGGFIVPLVGGGQGDVSLRIIVDDGVRPIILMPERRITVRDARQKKAELE